MGRIQARGAWGSRKKSRRACPTVSNKSAAVSYHGIERARIEATHASGVSLLTDRGHRLFVPYQDLRSGQVAFHTQDDLEQERARAKLRHRGPQQEGQ
ncbi:protein of unknown function [Candidatus Hydrogenisulfobacillus filiaventi]|uniref:Uncharacterized protein n=1 Tax=Candidatus Hydrogenisulfobacillus filiaventi TaxID=2707344 RepID=A0A6F8ZHX1_9FIRM|nr:protein of unknown function [Candidatus Hydrogenisulfobacillus filiaventi]